jgi:hypothetical protein
MDTTGRAHDGRSRFDNAAQEIGRGGARLRLVRNARETARCEGAITKATATQPMAAGEAPPTTNAGEDAGRFAWSGLATTPAPATGTGVAEASRSTGVRLCSPATSSPARSGKQNDTATQTESHTRNLP